MLLDVDDLRNMSPTKEKTEPFPGIAKVEWAFVDGRQYGLKGATATRGLMRLGLSFAATPIDGLNTKNWLNGFESGMQEWAETNGVLRRPESEPQSAF
jgi:hypothetical protein